MLSVQQALEEILNRIRPLDPEACPLDQALDRSLAEPVFADADFPPFDRSAMDGYAVCGAPISGAYTIVGTIFAGQMPEAALEPGQCVRIVTGAPVPPGTTRVIPQENVAVEGEKISLLSSDDSSELNVRAQGEDFREGDPVLHVGSRVGPAHLAVAASIGAMELRVTRRPQCAVFATGSELVTPDQRPGPGQIRSVNGILLDGMIRHAGGQLTHSYLVQDDPEYLAEAFARVLEDGADLFLISAGSSVGEKDFTRELLERFGFEIHFSGVNVRPGKPLIFATRGFAIAFGLPGNPVSHYVSFQLFVSAALAAMQGLPVPFTRLTGELEGEFDYQPNARETYWPAIAREEGGKTLLEPLPWNSSGHIASLVSANALICLPSGQGPFLAGTEFTWVPLRSLCE